MSFLRFVKSKAVALCCIVVALIAWCVFAALAGTGAYIIAITVIFVLFFTALWLGGEFYLVCGRLKKMKKLCREAEGYLLGEIITKPGSAVEEEYFEVVKRISSSAIEKIEESARELEGYRDFVERWIHEIKTPLTAISLILANGGDNKKIKTELKRAENLLESVLYYARLRTAFNDVQIKKASSKEIADEAVKSEMEILCAAGVSVETQGDITVCTDKNALVFIFKQFLVNCAKYCPGCKIKITSQENKIIFEDDGAGVAPHELPRIFARGFIGSAGRKLGGGTGMGLYIVSELCKSLSINLSVSSEPEKYTAFTLCFG